MLKSNLRFFLTPFLLSLFVIGLSFLYPLLFANLIDKIQTDSSTYLILPLYLISWFMSYTLIHVRELLSFYKTSKMIADVQKKFHNSYLFGALSNKVDKGKFYYLYHNIFDCLFTIINDILFNFFPLFIQILFVSVFLFFQYPTKYTFFLFLNIIIFLAASFFRHKKMHVFQRHGEKFHYMMGFQLEEMTINLDTIHSFQLNNIFVDKYEKLCDQYHLHETKTQEYGEISKIILVFICFLCIVSMTICAVWDINTKNLKLSDLVLITTYTSNILLPLNTIGQNYKGLRKKLLQLKEVFKFIDRLSKKQIFSDKYVSFSENSNSVLHLESISYHIDKKHLLRNITLTIKRGHLYVLTGENGSGKSTLSKIISGIYIPSGGRMYLHDSHPSPDTLLSTVSISPQNILVFEASILYNITFKEVDYDPHRLEMALRLSLLDKILEKFSQGVHTKIGKNYTNLSGGEKKLLSIARALYKKAQIYVFDEPTSSLDNKRQKEILKKITLLPDHPAIIIIEHKNIGNLSKSFKLLHLKNGQLYFEKKVFSKS